MSSLDFHRLVMVWTWFLIGYALHLGLQVDAIRRSKTNEAQTRWLVVKQNDWRLASRFFISIVLFQYALTSPGSLIAILGYLGVQTTTGADGLAKIPMNSALAGMIGWSIDSVLAFIPWFKNQLPPLEVVTRDETIKRTEEKSTVETRSVQKTVEPKAESPGGDGADVQK